MPEPVLGRLIARYDGAGDSGEAGNSAADALSLSPGPVRDDQGDRARVVLPELQGAGVGMGEQEHRIPLRGPGWRRRRVVESAADDDFAVWQTARRQSAGVRGLAVLLLVEDHHDAGAGLDSGDQAAQAVGLHEPTALAAVAGPAFHHAVVRVPHPCQPPVPDGGAASCPGSLPPALGEGDHRALSLPGSRGCRPRT